MKQLQYWMRCFSHDLQYIYNTNIKPKGMYHFSVMIDEYFYKYKKILDELYFVTVNKWAIHILKKFFTIGLGVLRKPEII